MSIRILSFGSGAAAFAALVFFAGQDSAQAARCPLGEIYRPSRGICVSKEKAIQAGIYRPSASPVAAKAEVPPVPSVNSKPRAQALAAIERRAPVENPGALAYTTGRTDAPVAAPVRAPAPAVAQTPVATPVLPKRVKAVPIVFSRPEPSPFGSLVALEPMP